MDQTRVVTRFAPSPTGSLHVGGARTALFNWAFARQHKGQFILRIEDTDVARSTQAATLGILRDLDWLGLDWDQGPAPHADNPYEHQKGEHGPYFQSQRLDIYRRYLQQLQDAGRVYEDGGALRFRMPDHPITVNDLVLGPVRVEPGTPQMEDFVIFKSEAAGSGPTFHFANVVDDHLMRVTHVIRGQEHLNNTVKHLALFEALGVEPPHYAHIPLIFNPDGSKMSKRDKAKAARQAALEAIQAGRWRRDELVEEAYNRWRGLVTLTDEPKRDIPREMFDAFLDKANDDIDVTEVYATVLHVDLPEIDVWDFYRSGYLPQVMVNYLALLGWNPGGDIEQFGPDPLGFVRDHFSLDRVQKAHARFDRDKLSRFNADALAKMPFESFRSLLAQHCSMWHRRFVRALDSESSERFSLFAQAYQGRCRTLEEPFQLGRFFIQSDHEIQIDEQARDKVLLKNDADGLKVLAELKPKLERLEDWSPEAIHRLIQDHAQQTGRGMGKVAQPVRVAVSGSTVSPPIDLTLAILDRESVIRRIDHCLTQCSKG